MQGKAEDSGSKEYETAVSSKVSQNIEALNKLFTDCPDLVVGEITIMKGSKKAAIAYVKGMVDRTYIERFIIDRLKNGSAHTIDEVSKSEKLDVLKNYIINSVQSFETDSMEQLANALFKGNTALFVDGIPRALVILTVGFEKRSVEKPDMEISLHGAKDSFTESIRTNLMLLRRRLPTTSLKFKEFSLGRLSRTQVYVCWLDGIADPAIIKEVCSRLDKINVDYISTINMIAEFIEDSPLSIWPQYKNTERPDIAAPNLAEGRIAILADGFPFALVVPIMLVQELQSVDDYAQKPVIASFFRLIRYIGTFISMIASAIYLAFVAYNHTVIPPDLAIRISNGREGVPFPSIIEIMLMTIIIDLLREAGLRLPMALGSAISILGAVVIGQAAVEAGYFSPSLIIIISISAISAYVIPDTNLANTVRLVNYFLIIMAGVFGIFGINCALIFLFWTVTRSRSFGIDMAYPVDTGKARKLKDIFIRTPFSSLSKRPEILAPDNDTRYGRKKKN